MTLQEIFDKGVAGILEQGKPAMTEMIGCRYRTPDGLACLIGQCIPDELYDSSFEGYTANHHWIREPLGIHASIADDVYNLQQCHDNAAKLASGEDFIPDFIARCRSFAKGRSIDTRVIDEYERKNKL